MEQVGHRGEVGVSGVGRAAARDTATPHTTRSTLAAAGGVYSGLLGRSGAGVICRGSLAQLLELRELQVAQHHLWSS